MGARGFPIHVLGEDIRHRDTIRKLMRKLSRYKYHPSWQCPNRHQVDRHLFTQAIGHVLSISPEMGVFTPKPKGGKTLPKVDHSWLRTRSALIIDVFPVDEHRYPEIIHLSEDTARYRHGVPARDFDIASYLYSIEFQDKVEALEKFIREKLQPALAEAA
jgi:hypothetical protein